MTPEHQAFLNAIIANPEDPVPRLVFADYLEESGEPALIARAQFIRGQIEHSGLDVHFQFTAKGHLDNLSKMFRDEASVILEPLNGMISDAYRYGGFLESLCASWELVVSEEFTRLLKITPLLYLRITSALSSERIRAIDRQANVDQWLLENQQGGYWPKQRIFFPCLRSFIWMPSAATHYDIMDSLSVIWKVVEAPRLTSLEINSEYLDEGLMTWLLANWAESSLSQNVLTLAFNRTLLTDRVASTLCSAPGFDRVRQLIFAEKAFSSTTRERLKQRFGQRLKYYWRS